MKKILVTLGLLGMAVGLFVWQRGQQMKPSQETPAAESKNLSAGQKGEKPWFASKARKSPEKAEQPEENSLLNQEAFRKLLDETNMESSMHLTAAVQKLRAHNDDQIAGFFLEELHALGQGNSTGRGRLVFLANALQSPKLLPFWEDLALRLTPSHTNEPALLKTEEPSLSSMAISMEMNIALRNVGIIALGNHRASEVLLQVINDPNPGIHDAFIRERAFIALKESDLTASLRVLKTLKEEDPLMARIRSAQSHAQ